MRESSVSVKKYDVMDSNVKSSKKYLKITFLYLKNMFFIILLKRSIQSYSTKSCIIRYENQSQRNKKHVRRMGKNIIPFMNLKYEQERLHDIYFLRRNIICINVYKKCPLKLCTKSIRYPTLVTYVLRCCYIAARTFCNS